MSRKNDVMFCIDLGPAVPYKKKKNLIDLITSNGAKVSFNLNKKVTFLLLEDKSNTSGYKARQAFKLGIPVLHADFIYEWISESNTQLLNIKKYLIKNNQNIENLKQGIISKRNFENI